MPSHFTTASPIPAYRPCHNSFHTDDHLINEKLLDHGHIHPHYEFQNRNTRPTHRDLSTLSLTTSLLRVHWTQYHGEPACLLTFRFQFQGSTHRTPFEKAEIRMAFSSHGDDPDPSLEILAIIPSPVVVDAEITDPAPRRTSTCTFPSNPPTHTPAHTSSTLLHEKGRTHPTVAKFWLREDIAQSDGRPVDFECTVVVKDARAQTFQGIVDVKVGPVFEFVARAWSGRDPLVLEPGLEFGDDDSGKGRLHVRDGEIGEWR